MNNYLALVGRGTSGYREVFAPGSPSLAEDAGTVIMSGFTGSTTSLQWRIWIPPGTRSLQATIYTYASPPESKILMRMHQPPVGGLDSVTPENSAAVDMTNVLESLFQGAEIPCYTPAGVGAVKLSSGRMDSPVVTTTGGWLYINALQVPGQQIFKLDSYLSADQAQYLNWYSQAVWDADGNPVAGETKPPVPVETHEQKVLRRVIETGLAEALRTLSGGKPDAELIQAVLESGVWATLLEFERRTLIKP